MLKFWVEKKYIKDEKIIYISFPLIAVPFMTYREKQKDKFYDQT